MMKRIFPIFLLILFLYNSLGYYLTFKVQMYQSKKEMKRKLINSLTEGELILISFHSSSKEYKKIEWIEDHEFRYKGQLYDVVKKLIDTEGIIHYYCLNDKQEEKLFAHLDEHIKNHISSDQTNKRNNNKSLLKKIVSEYFFSCPLLAFIPDTSKVWYSTNSSLIFDFKLSPPTPPPKLV